MTVTCIAVCYENVPCTLRQQVSQSLDKVVTGTILYIHSYMKRVSLTIKYLYLLD